MIDLIILFILTYLLADYVLDYEEPKFIALLYIFFFIVYTKLPVGWGDLGIEFTLDYYVNIFFTQIVNLFKNPDTMDELNYPRINSNFAHNYKYFGKPQKTRTSHQFLASWPIDIFNEKLEYAFIGGGEDQHDALLRYRGGKLVNIMKGNEDLQNILSDKRSATYSAVSFDMNGDGKYDLLVARQNGVVLYHNRSYVSKSGERLFRFHKQVLLGQDTFRDSSPVALSIGDYNLSGRPDIYS